MPLKLNGVTITVNKLNGNNIHAEFLNDVVVYDARPPLSEPQGSLTDKFDYTEGANWNGGVMLIGLYNSNTEGVRLNGRILFGGSDVTSEFTHFPNAGYYFFGDGFPPNTGLTDGLSVISGGMWTYEWLYPITIEIWFEPIYNDSTRSKSDKLIITVNS